MSTLPAREELTVPDGIPSGKRQDIFYFAGMVLQVFGAAVLAVLYPMGSPFYSAGIMLFEAGALLSAVFLLIWISWLKKLLLGSILIGIALQATGLFFAQPQHAAAVILGGICLVCMGTAGMAGKEAYCYGWREGWILMWLYPSTMLILAVGNEHMLVNSLVFSSHFLLVLLLTGKKLRQRRLSAGSKPQFAPSVQT